MKQIVFLLSFIFLFNTSYTQNETFKEYSYTEFFDLIEQEKDTVFRLSDVLVRYNKETDQRFKMRLSTAGEMITDEEELLVVDKKVELNNVHFLINLYFDSAEGMGYMDGALKNIHFTKDVTLENTLSFNVNKCQFSGTFRYSLTNCELAEEGFTDSTYHSISNSTFNTFRLFMNCDQYPGSSGYLVINNNLFNTRDTSFIFNMTLRNLFSAAFYENEIITNGLVNILFEGMEGTVNFTENNIVADNCFFDIKKVESSITLKDNQFSSSLYFEIDELKSKDKVDWPQFEGKLITGTSFNDFILGEEKKLFWLIDTLKRKQLVSNYLDSIQFYNSSAFANEIGLKGLFYDYYKSKHNIETANRVYLELKNFETRRLKVLYKQNPSFRTYFKWKVNQFLKLFSDYGTEPSKAIVFSLYVILFFALIYLFFPNSWDRHGKNRIVDRYTFFMKYMDRKAGIHEVYLEDKEAELLTYNRFKDFIHSSEHKVPKFFTATALPLYKWAVSGTRLSSGLLKKMDIMKGTWSELPEKRRWWKGVLLIGAFCLAILYDLFIKMLNALMLSINTFTTLGFGEIPIRGLPRYLAIIQGFIGWFMLTIFSVSLISQLLN